MIRHIPANLKRYDYRTCTGLPLSLCTVRTATIAVGISVFLLLGIAADFSAPGCGVSSASDIILRKSLLPYLAYSNRSRCELSVMVMSVRGLCYQNVTEQLALLSTYLLL
jgi:hypothetical protein